MCYYLNVHFQGQRINPQNHEKCMFITDARSKVLFAWVSEPAGWRVTGLFLRWCHDEFQSMEPMTCLIRVYTYMNNVQKQVLWPSMHHNAIRWKEIVNKDVAFCQSKCLLNETLLTIGVTWKDSYELFTWERKRLWTTSKQCNDNAWKSRWRTTVSMKRE